MNDITVKVENLGKLYRIGAQQEQYRTLRETLVGSFLRPIRRIHSKLQGPRTPLSGKSGTESNNNVIWALNDVSFEVKQGDVIGIIGRNGAGKSTLLKILAHITEPTRGRVILNGRVGSLLEVGTGFHPELTGRENIFLNGAILGMKKVEIKRKFDEIVAFAEIEKFLDTPVKHYSSGMYVRLAFAVAAHMEPEILLIDEVLAVGDLAFQKKCLGKMGQVAGEGRTVLFVSHDMVAMRSLCKDVFLIESGKIIASGKADDVINKYITSANSKDEKDYVIHTETRNREGNGKVVFQEWWIEDTVFGKSRKARTCHECTFKINYESKSDGPLQNVSVTLTVNNSYGQPVFSTATYFIDSDFRSIPKNGEFSCHLNDLPLNPGTYILHLYCRVQNDVAERITNAGSFEVTTEDVYGTGKMTNRYHGDVIIKD
ncbi:MAG: ABC transporter ATP-binding protein, partial [Bacteroidales bacterium]|nr:ABC transporter ATP-binding protein [Bacteroidales bacterium]